MMSCINSAKIELTFTHNNLAFITLLEGRHPSPAPFSYLTLYCLIVNESSGPKRVTHHVFYSVHIHISKDRVILTIPHRISNPKSLISLQPTKAFMRLS